MTGPATPRPRARPRTSAVLPAPSGPESTTRSPARRSAASRSPEGLGVGGVGQLERGVQRHRAGVRSGAHARLQVGRCAAQRAIRSASAASITSGCSSIGRCPTPGSRTRVGPGQLGGDDLAVPEGDQPRPRRPPRPAPRSPRAPGRAATRSCVPRVSTKSVSASTGVRADHRVDEVDARRVDAAVAVGRTGGSAPRSGRARTRRAPSTSSGCQPATRPSPRVSGLRRDRKVPGSPRLATSAAEVAEEGDARAPARRTGPAAARRAP